MMLFLHNDTMFLSICSKCNSDSFKLPKKSSKSLDTYLIKANAFFPGLLNYRALSQFVVIVQIGVSKNKL